MKQNVKIFTCRKKVHYYSNQLHVLVSRLIKECIGYSNKRAHCRPQTAAAQTLFSSCHSAGGCCSEQRKPGGVESLKLQ